MNKVLTIGLWILCLALILLAAAPSTPSVLSPVNGSIYFKTPILTCSGSADADGDPIYYEFYNPGGIVYPTVSGGYIEDEDFEDAVMPYINIGNQGAVPWARTNAKASNGTWSFTSFSHDADWNFSKVSTTTYGYNRNLSFYVWEEDTGADGAGLILKVYNDSLCNRGSTGANDIYKVYNSQNFRINGITMSAPYNNNQWVKWTLSRMTNGSVQVWLDDVSQGSFPYAVATYGEYINCIYFNHVRAGMDSYVDTIFETGSFEGAIYNLIQNSTATTTGNISNTTLPIGNYSTWNCRAYANGDVSSFTENRTLFHGQFYNCSRDCAANRTLNITFMDELNGSAKLGAIQLLSFGFNSSDKYEFAMSHPLVNDTHPFALTPPAYTITAAGNISYKGEDVYTHQRNFFFENALRGNNIFNQTLFLLSIDDGIEEVVRVEDATSTAIEDVRIVIYKAATPPAYDLNTYTLIVGDYTGADGTVTFWLDPSVKHKYVLTKPGYTTVTKYVQPSASGHTFTMELASSDAEYSAPTQGMMWQIGPPIGPVSSGTSTSFQFNITSTLGNLRWCSMNITNGTGGIVATATGCNVAATYYGENISAAYTPISGDKLYGSYYITVDAECDDTSKCSAGVLKGETCVDDADCLMYGLLDADAYWVEYPFNYSQSNLKEALISLRDWNDFGECDVYGHCPEQEASRIIFFFLFSTILIGAIVFFTGIEMVNPGQALLLALALVLAGSLIGFFEIHSYSFVENWAPFIDKYTIAIIVGLVASGWILNDWRRSHMT